MGENNEKKLDWMYKSANSLVNREEYLLGRSVDKTLEQLNSEEKQHKIVLPTPKNHVEHECIPPSIRDFNKIVQVDQVDLSAKLQEDPLVAIKKREEEARRQFLQNPVQLKKLQEALKAQEEKKRKKVRKKHRHSDSDSDLESKITEKLKLLKGKPVAVPHSKTNKKSKATSLDTILMHKFNALKDHLSEEDLKDILRGGEVKKQPKKKKYSDTASDSEDPVKISKVDVKKKQRHKKKQTSSDDDRIKNGRSSEKINKKTSTSYDYPASTSKNNEISKNEERYDRSNFVNNRCNSRILDNKLFKKEQSKGTNDDSDLDRKITEKLRLLRGETEKNLTGRKQLLPEKPEHLKRHKTTSSDSSDSEALNKDYTSKRPAVYDSDDSDETSPKTKSYGLVTSDGKKIAFKQKEQNKKFEKQTQKLSKAESHPTYERKQVKKLSEEEKDKLRQEMIKHAKVRDKEREENLRKHRESNEMEEFSKNKYSKELVHMELMKSSKEMTVEERIKSNLSNIQRSSRHMDSNFSKR